ncbi:MAG: cytochrome c [Deltaproteobacteria bacterium]|nr:cytochrome c [Deltaproteobacteria bacterium]
MKKIIFILLFTALPALAADPGAPFSQARKLVNSQGCKACHQLENEGGDYAKPLEEVGRHKSGQKMRELLLKGIRNDDGRYMPSYSHLRETEIKALVNYLESYK